MVFKPGQSGNPFGKRAKADTALSYQGQAQKWAGEGLTKLRKLIKSKNESIALRASIAMGEIAWPKSQVHTEDVPLTTPDGVPVNEGIEIEYYVESAETDQTEPKALNGQTPG